MAQEKEDRDLIASQMLLKEADEELRKENLQKIWKDYGGYLIIFCVSLVIGTGAFAAYREYDRKQQQASTDALLDWRRNPTKEINVNIADNTGSAVDAQNWMKMFLAAREALGNNDLDKAADLYDRLKKAPQHGAEFHWMVSYMDVKIAAQKAQGVEGHDWAGAMQSFADLGDAPENPWRTLAYMDAAVIAGEKIKDMNKALTYIQAAKETAQGSMGLVGILDDLEHLYKVEQQKIAQSEPKDEGNAQNSEKEDKGVN